MTVQVDEKRCIGCGMCAAAVPAVFGIRGQVSTVLAQPRTAAEESRAFDAANGCPVNAGLRQAPRLRSREDAL